MNKLCFKFQPLHGNIQHVMRATCSSLQWAMDRSAAIKGHPAATHILFDRWEIGHCQESNCNNTGFGYRQCCYLSSKGGPIPSRNIISVRMWYCHFQFIYNSKRPRFEIASELSSMKEPAVGMISWMKMLILFIVEVMKIVFSAEAWIMVCDGVVTNEQKEEIEDTSFHHLFMASYASETDE